MLAALSLVRWSGQGLTFGFRFHLLRADAWFQVQQQELRIAELLAFRPVFPDHFEAQTLFQRADFQLRALQFPRQKNDVLGFRAGWRERALNSPSGLLPG
jgi:hypothetical protein